MGRSHFSEKYAGTAITENLSVQLVKRSTRKNISGIIGKICKAVQWLFIKIIRFYQLAISPYLGPSCRHAPTCSTYMIEAIQEWGVLRGIWMGLKRLARCHPWGTSGYDPVPKNEEENENEKM